MAKSYKRKETESTTWKKVNESKKRENDLHVQKKLMRQKLFEFLERLLSGTF